VYGKKKKKEITPSANCCNFDQKRDRERQRERDREIER
jgi:hypothetical protein